MDLLDFSEGFEQRDLDVGDSLRLAHLYEGLTHLGQSRHRKKWSQHLGISWGGYLHAEVVVDPEEEVGVLHERF